MKTVEITKKTWFGEMYIERVAMPRIYRSKRGKGKLIHWACSNGDGHIGYGKIPAHAFDRWKTSYCVRDKQ